MALWGDEDNANSVPKYLSSANTAIWPNDVDQAYFIDTTEAAVADNREKGLKTGGWNVFDSYTDANGATRYKVENIVAMRRTAADAGDLGVTGNTAVEDVVVPDTES